MENGGGPHEARKNDEGVPEVRRNDEKNEANAVIVPYVRCDEIRWTGSEIIAEMTVLDASESLSSWTSWKRRIRRNHPGAYRHVVGWLNDSC